MRGLLFFLLVLVVLSLSAAEGPQYFLSSNTTLRYKNQLQYNKISAVIEIPWDVPSLQIKSAIVGQIFFAIRNPSVKRQFKVAVGIIYMRGDKQWHCRTFWEGRINYPSQTAIGYAYKPGDQLEVSINIYKDYIDASCGVAGQGLNYEEFPLKSSAFILGLEKSVISLDKNVNCTAWPTENKIQFNFLYPSSNQWTQSTFDCYQGEFECNHSSNVCAA